MYLDLAILNEAHGQAVALTDAGQLLLVGPITLAAHDALTLARFLGRNDWSMQCLAGIAQLADIVAVWRPSALRMLCEMRSIAFFQAITHARGQLTPEPLRIEDEGLFYFVGLTANLQEVVLVPSHCYFARFRACLVERACKALQTDDIWTVAAAIEAGQEAHDPAGGSPWTPVELAHQEARDIAYWRRQAGTSPLPGDTRDARVERRYRVHRSGGGS